MMSGRLAVIFLAVVSTVTAQTGGQAGSSSGKGKCFVPDKDRYQFFGSRTSYEYARGKITPIRDSSCEPVKIWGLLRHGTKYPDADTLPKIMNLPKLRDAIVQNHARGAGQLCSADIEKLKKWKLDKNFDPKMDEFLAPQGVKDLVDLAGRLKAAYPRLFRNAKPEDFTFRSTNTQRTQESMMSFIKGLFGNTRNAKIIEPPEKDTLLKPFKFCPKWTDGKTSKLIYAERDKFAKGPVVQKILQDISARLGFATTITFEDFVAFYEACRFENALYLNKVPIWCSILKKNELQAMEYRDDLRIYTYVGPGREINGKMGCFLLSDLFKHFTGAGASTSSNKEPKGVFYFAHSKNIQSLLTAYRIGFGDKPLKAEDYAANANRNFRTSKLGSFAANFIAVLHKCKDDTSKVTFHVSEHLTPVESCKDAGACDWKSLVQAYKKDVDTCSMDDCFK